MHIVLVGPEFEENLSLRYLAASLEQAGHTASLARFDALEYTESVVQQVLREQPGMVGLSLVFQVRAQEFCDLARALRHAGYKGHLTAGGHFATFACEDLLRDVPALDSIVRQEGEETLVELVNAVQSGVESTAWAQIPGMVTRDAKGTVAVAPPRHQGKHLDLLPPPVRSRTPEYHLGVPTSYLVGSRGCYADCEYCCIFAWHEAAVGKRYRMRTVANIADEMQTLYHTRGIRFFVFHDDNFFLPTPTGNRKRFEGLRTEIKARGLNDIGLMLKLRPNDCDRANMEILKDMGLLRAFVGIENASPRQMKSLGRDTSLEDIESCLQMLRELGIYCTYNILLFDPYTTLDDIDINLRFLRRNLFYPFNWCKVEPYAGTELEKRYGREGRLRGDYMGYDYVMDDPRARLLYDLLLPAFYYRNYDYYGLANLNIGLGYHRQLLRHFYPQHAAPELDRHVQTLIEAINGNALDLLEKATDFVRQVDLNDSAAIEQFRVRLKEESFHWQHVYSGQVESILRAIEQAVGVGTEDVGSVPVAFVPLNSESRRNRTKSEVDVRTPSGAQRAKADRLSGQHGIGTGRHSKQAGHKARAERGKQQTTNNKQQETVGKQCSYEPLVLAQRLESVFARWWKGGASGADEWKQAQQRAHATGWPHLRLAGAVGGSLLLMLTGCQKSEVKPSAGQVPPAQIGSTPGKTAHGGMPQGTLRVAQNSPDTVVAGEPMILEALLLPADAQVLGEPRTTTDGGRIGHIDSSQGGRLLRITYYPSGASRNFNPNVTLTVAWTVQGTEGDMVVMARGFIHVNEDKSYAFGYETPRPTIAEMAAPPIYQGPKPSGGG